MDAPEHEQFVSIKVREETRQQLKLLAALTHRTMADAAGDVVAEALAKARTETR